MDAIIAFIESLGYAVTLTRSPDAVEVRAMAADGTTHVARCADGEGPDQEYAAACELARMVGVDLEDG